MNQFFSAPPVMRKCSPRFTFMRCSCSRYSELVGARKPCLVTFVHTDSTESSRRVFPARLSETEQFPRRLPDRDLASAHRGQPGTGPRQEPEGFVLEKTGWIGRWRRWRRRLRRGPTIPRIGTLGGTHAAGARRTGGRVERSVLAFAAAARHFLPAL